MDPVIGLVETFATIFCKVTNINIDCGLDELIKIGTLNIPAFLNLQKTISLRPEYGNSKEIALTLEIP